VVILAAVCVNSGGRNKRASPWVKIIETAVFLEHKKLHIKYITNKKAWMTINSIGKTGSVNLDGCAW
jgi:hypothetical protein